jgi:hypothetical protein
VIFSSTGEQRDEGCYSFYLSYSISLGIKGRQCDVLLSDIISGRCVHETFHVIYFNAILYLMINSNRANNPVT